MLFNSKVAMLIVAAVAGPTFAALPSAEALKTWGDAEVVFVGKLDQVVAGPVGLSFPPLYSHRLVFTVSGALRGGMPMGGKFKASHSARQKERPVFPAGKKCVVAAKTGRGGNRVLAVFEATDKNMAEAAAVCAIPIGWRVEGKSLLSPWASLEGAKWDGPKSDTELVCEKSGRPALLAGRDIKLTVEHVPPAKAIKWTNPDGDGQYRVTLTNTSDMEIPVPALVRHGKDVLWKESLAVVCQGRAYPLPAATGKTGPCETVKLKPGQSISTTVNALQLDGPKWPRGGYRIEFQFCLGEKSVTKSFYYMSRHHDKIRKEARAKLKKS